MEVDVGEIIAEKYTLVRLLGTGAMGQVWVARHQGLQQTFAIKLMMASIESEDVSLRRFENEAQIAAALSRKSRNIASVTDYGVDRDVAYLVMELLEGESLDKRIGDGRRLDPAAVSTLVTQLAKGLAVAHAEGVTHRDLKPANIFIARNTDDGMPLVKLLDFGIARMDRRIVNVKNTARAPTKLTVKGLVLGTPSYMSPEQAMADKTDARVDVWALAVVAFEALAGVTPFDAESADTTIKRICNLQSTRLRAVMPRASEELENIFVRAFSARIAARFQTALEFADALAAALPAPAPTIVAAPISSHPPASAMDETRGEAPAQKKKLAPMIAIGAGVVFVLLMAAIVVPRVLASPTAIPNVREPNASAGIPSASSAIPIRDVAPPVMTAAPTVTLSATTATATATAHTHTQPAITTTTTATATAAPTTTKSVDRSAIF